MQTFSDNVVRKRSFIKNSSGHSVRGALFAGNRRFPAALRSFVYGKFRVYWKGTVVLMRKDGIAFNEKHKYQNGGCYA